MIWVMDNAASRAYVEGSRFFVDLVKTIADEEWSGVALGEWSVLDLVAHANRSHLVVVEYLESPFVADDLPPDYFSAANVSARARQAAVDLGDDPVASVVGAAARAADVVAAAADDATIGTPMGVLPLDRYLASRVAELLIHGVDLADALGRPAAVPPEAAVAAMGFLGWLAALRGSAADVLRALSGRSTLPPGFTLY